MPVNVYATFEVYFGPLTHSPSGRRVIVWAQMCERSVQRLKLNLVLNRVSLAVVERSEPNSRGIGQELFLGVKRKGVGRSHLFVDRPTVAVIGPWLDGRER